MFNSNNNNPGFRPQIQDTPVATQPALSASTSSASLENTTNKQLAPSATELMANLQGPPVPEGQCPQLSDTSSLPENTNLLDLDTDSSFPLAIQVAPAASPAQVPGKVKHPSLKDLSHWVTFSDDEDSTALAEGLDKLLVSEQNKSTFLKTGTDLEL